MRIIYLALVPFLALIACSNSESGSGSFGGSSSWDDTSASGADQNDPKSRAFFEKTIGDRVFFEVDQYTLNASAKMALDVQAEWLMDNRDYVIIVEGHADERGTREYNLALGERRANSAKNYLVALGVEPSRINTISYGKERPAVPGSNDTSWSQNRRGVTKVN